MKVFGPNDPIIIRLLWAVLMLRANDEGHLRLCVRPLKPCGVSEGIVRDVVEAVGASLGKPVGDSLLWGMLFGKDWIVPSVC